MDSAFGRPGNPSNVALGLPAGAGYDVACTDPGLLSGMSGPFGLTTLTEPFAPGVILAVLVATTGPPELAPTTWVESADRYQGTCRRINGANVLRYDPVGNSRRPNAFQNMGTHVLDMNLGARAPGGHRRYAGFALARPAALPQDQRACPCKAQVR